MVNVCVYRSVIKHSFFFHSLDYILSSFYFLDMVKREFVIANLHI